MNGYSEWSMPTLCKSRMRSPLKIQEAVEEKGRIDSVTNVHRKYFLYSSESRCVHLFHEKVTRYVRPARRCRLEKFRGRNKDCTTYSSKLSASNEAISNHALPTSRPCFKEQFLPSEYLETLSSKSRSCHSKLNMNFYPDFNSPRFVRPCKMNKEMNVKMEEGNGRKVPAIEMKPQCEAQSMDTGPPKYAEEFKHFINHYLGAKKTEKLEGSTLLMDTLSLILSTVSPYVNRMLHMLWRVKYLADKALHRCIPLNVTVK